MRDTSKDYLRRSEIDLCQTFECRMFVHKLYVSLVSQHEESVASVSEQSGPPSLIDRRANQAGVTAYLLYNGSATYVY